MKRLLVALVLVMYPVCVLAVEPQQRPEFPEILLTAPNGQTQSVSDFRGMVTVVNFWATWCGPCRMELPELERLYNELGAKGLVVLAVNVEGGRAPVEPFMQRMGLSLPVFTVDGRTQAELGISSIPFTVLLDRQGRVARAYPGYSKAGMADLQQLAAVLLAEKVEKAEKAEKDTKPQDRER